MKAWAAMNKRQGQKLTNNVVQSKVLHWAKLKCFRNVRQKNVFKNYVRIFQCLLDNHEAHVI